MQGETKYNNNYTNILFETSSIRSETDKNDYRSIKATKKIPKGSLLLAEQVMTGNECELFLAVCSSPDLFNSLAPRTKVDLKSILEVLNDVSIQNLITTKIHTNRFYSQPHDEDVIGKHLSWFNHKAEPNAFVKFDRTSLRDMGIDDHGDNIPIDFAYVITCKDIEINEEITISYGWEKKMEGVIPGVHSFMDSKVDTYEKWKRHEKTCLNIINNNNNHYLKIIKKYLRENLLNEQFINRVPQVHFAAKNLGLYFNGWENRWSDFK